MFNAEALNILHIDTVLLSYRINSQMSTAFLVAQWKDHTIRVGWNTLNSIVPLSISVEEVLLS